MPCVELQRLDAESLAGHPGLPVGPDRAVAEGHDRRAQPGRQLQHRVHGSLWPQLVERLTSIVSAEIRIEPLVGDLEVGPERAPELVALRPRELGVEPRVHPVRRDERRQEDRHPGRDQRNRQAAHGMPDHDRVRLRPHKRRVIAHRKADLLARKVGRPGLVTPPLQLT